MRKLGMGIVALLLLGGAASAREGAELKSLQLNRWAFGGAGPTEAQVVDRNCPHDRVITSNKRRTQADWAAVVFTAGMYTPEHVVLQCATP